MSFLRFRKAKTTCIISQPTFAFTTSGVVHYFGCGRDWERFTHGGCGGPALNRFVEMIQGCNGISFTKKVQFETF
jgi:hypothetical protein